MESYRNFFHRMYLQVPEDRKYNYIMKVTNKDLYKLVSEFRSGDTLNVVSKNKDFKSVYFPMDITDFLRYNSSMKVNEDIYPYEVTEDCGDLYIHLALEN